MKNRALLIALLSFFAILGPLVADEDAAAAEPADPAVDLRSFYPEPGAVDARMSAGEFKVFGRKNLYDYINGGAEVYLDLGFIRVMGREYSIELDEQTYFTIDVYDMGKPIQAFGIFSAERYDQEKTINVGLMGYLDQGSLCFYSRDYYVKIQADDANDEVNRILLKMAYFVGGKMGDAGKLPSELALFPAAKRAKDGVKYAAANLLGLKDLTGFSCLYANKDDELNLYLCRCESDEAAAKTVAVFLKRFKIAVGRKMDAKSKDDGRELAFKSRYIGRGRLKRSGPFVAIATGLEGDEQKDVWRLKIIAEFNAKIHEAQLAKKRDQGLKWLEGGK